MLSRVEHEKSLITLALIGKINTQIFIMHSVKTILRLREQAPSL